MMNKTTKRSILFGMMSFFCSLTAHAAISGGFYSRPRTHIRIPIQQTATDQNNTYTLSPFEAGELNTVLDALPAAYFQGLTLINILPVSGKGNPQPGFGAAAVSVSESGDHLNLYLPPDLTRENNPNADPVGVFTSLAMATYAFQTIVGPAVRDQWTAIAQKSRRIFYTDANSTFDLAALFWTGDYAANLQGGIFYASSRAPILDPTVLQECLFMAAILADPGTRRTPLCVYPDESVRTPAADCANTGIVRTSDAIVIGDMTLHLSPDQKSIVSADFPDSPTTLLVNPVSVPSLFLTKFPLQRRRVRSSGPLQALPLVSHNVPGAPASGGPRRPSRMRFTIGDSPALYRPLPLSDVSDPTLSPHRVTRLDAPP